MDYKVTPQSGNSYTHLWDVSTERKYDGGFTLDKSSLPDNLKELPRGTFLKVDNEERIAKVVKTVSLFEALVAESTSVKVKKGSLLKKNDVLGINDKFVIVGDIDHSNADFDSFTIEAGALGEALEINAVLQSYASGKSENPDGFNYEDKPIERETTVTVVYAVDKVVAERLPYPLTDAIVSALKHCQILVK